MKQKTIVMIGAGNLSTHLALALSEAGHRVVAIYSKTEAHAKQLAEKVGQCCSWHTDLTQLPPADFFLIAVSDSAISAVTTKIPPHCRDGIVLHTSGSTPLSALSAVGTRTGVLYPLQTFSKSKAVNFKEIPCFIEAMDLATEQEISELASSISNVVQRLDSSQRRTLHLSAVFACNFVNHLYDIATKLVEAEGGNRDWLLPLIRETAQKISHLSPHDAQTGPAVRGDEEVMRQHIALLSGKAEWQTLYQSISDSIFKSFHP